jgi:hypothetical protein
MKTTTVSAPRPGALNSAANNGKTNVAAATTLSVRRLNVMRIGYAVMGAGIATRNWPSLNPQRAVASLRRGHQLSACCRAPRSAVLLTQP